MLSVVDDRWMDDIYGDVIRPAHYKTGAIILYMCIETRQCKGIISV